MWAGVLWTHLSPEKWCIGGKMGNFFCFLPYKERERERERERDSGATVE